MLNGGAPPALLALLCRYYAGWADKIHGKTIPNDVSRELGRVAGSKRGAGRERSGQRAGVHASEHKEEHAGTKGAEAYTHSGRTPCLGGAPRSRPSPQPHATSPPYRRTIPSPPPSLQGPYFGYTLHEPIGVVGQVRRAGQAGYMSYMHSFISIPLAGVRGGLLQRLCSASQEGVRAGFGPATGSLQWPGMQPALAQLAPSSPNIAPA